jgi:hypothetical protein
MYIMHVYQSHAAVSIILQSTVSVLKVSLVVASRLLWAISPTVFGSCGLFHLLSTVFGNLAC